MGKKIVTLIVSLFMMGVVVTCGLFYFLKNEVANTDTYHHVLQEINAGLTVQTEVENSLIDLMLVNNMPTEWVRDLIDVELMQTRLHQNIDGVEAALLNQEFFSNEIDINQVMSVFDERVKSYLRAENKYLEEADLESLELVKSEMRTIIQNETTVLNPLFLSNSGTVSNLSFIIQSVLNLPIILISLVVLLFLGVIQQLLFFKSWYEGVRYTGVGIASGGLFFVIIGLSGKLSGFYKNPMIQDGYLKDLAVNLGEHFLSFFIEIGLFISCIGLCFVIPYLICSYKQFVKE